jgi:SAM-dependent methyltransferase
MTDDVASNRDRTSPDKNGDDTIDAWERVGPQWGRNRDRLFDGFRPASSWLIDHVDPQPGQTILELAAGPGETGFLAAERVGPTGRLISTDLAPSMVDAARLGAEARGLGNVDCRVMDAQHIDLPDASVDAVISRLGLMLVPEPRAAFREIRRVLRPGGRLAYAVLGTPDRNQWLSLLIGAAIEHGAAPAGDNPFALGRPFGLSSPEVNKELLRDVGFSDIQAGELSGVMSFASANDYWDYQTALSPPVRATIASMGPDEVASVRATLEQMLSPFESDGRYDLPTLVVVVVAR